MASPGRKIAASVLQEMILRFCEKPRAIGEIAAHLGLRDRKGVRVRGVAPLLEQGRLAMTVPDKPQSRFQKYVAIT